MLSFYKFWEEIQFIPSQFGTAGASFPTPPPFWLPAYMDMYPKDVMQAVRQQMEKTWPNSSRSLEPVVRSVANYVYNWSLAPKNVYKRIVYNAGQRGLGMDEIMAMTKNVDQYARQYKPKYPSPVGIPTDFRHLLQIAV
jgi:hypothetical protein